MAPWSPFLHLHRVTVRVTNMLLWPRLPAVPVAFLVGANICNNCRLGQSYTLTPLPQDLTPCPAPADRQVNLSGKGK